MVTNVSLCMYVHSYFAKYLYLLTYEKHFIASQSLCIFFLSQTYGYFGLSFNQCMCAFFSL